MLVEELQHRPRRIIEHCKDTTFIPNIILFVYTFNVFYYFSFCFVNYP